jgi:hypothetical protein
MRGLVPRIHGVLLSRKKHMDGRNKSGHDDPEGRISVDSKRMARHLYIATTCNHGLG